MANAKEGRMKQRHCVVLCNVELLCDIIRSLIEVMQINISFHIIYVCILAGVGFELRALLTLEHRCYLLESRL
jgi:hypothetical protein